MNYTCVPDTELLTMLADSKVEAFDEIYRRYWSNMYNSAYNILRDKDSCMDIVQELFIWLWEHRTQLDVDSLKSYLLVAVKFKVTNYIRRGKVRQSYFDKLKKIDEPCEIVEDSVEVKELIQIINHFTGQLPPKCKEVFLLSRQEYLSNKEIAEKLGVSVKTVENQMTIALRKLRISLSRVNFFLFLFLMFIICLGSIINK